MGIAIHNVSAGNGEDSKSMNLSAALRRDAGGLLGTTVEYGELVCHDSLDIKFVSHLNFPFQVIPFVAGGFLYIGAVAVLPT